MKKILLVILLILLGGFACNAGRQEIGFKKKQLPSAHPPLPAAAEVLPPTATTYIHYDPRYCSACHLKLPAGGNDKLLKFEGDFKYLCKCHFTASETYLHPVDVEPSEAYKARMSGKFPLSGGKITCGTCHDIYLQCQEDQKFFQKENKFLRKNPAEKVSDFCFECHDKSKYKMYNPHLQLDRNGAVIEVKCLYCHTKIPDVNRADYHDVKLIGNIKPLCRRCHIKLSHRSLHDRHVGRKPSKKVLATIKAIQRQYNTILPLSEDGELVCATCHNPHQKGTIPASRAGARGAGEHYRHRLPGNICMKCHQM